MNSNRSFYARNVIFKDRKEVIIVRVFVLVGFLLGLFASVAHAAPHKTLPIAAPADSLDGACCDSLTYDCVVMPEEDCMAMGGIWFGPGSSCDPNP